MDESATIPDEPERWLPIAGYDYYEVSNLGRVRSLRRQVGRFVRGGRILKLYYGTTGYAAVTLYQDGHLVRHFVHRLVAAAFIGPCPEGQEVRHGPNGKRDNRASQLCYGTRADNMRDKRRDGTQPVGESHHWGVLTEDAVIDIRTRYAAGGVTQRTLGLEHGISSAEVGAIVRGEAWTHIGGPLTTGRPCPLERSRTGKFGSAEVIEIRRRHGNGETIIALSREYDLHRKTVGRIVRGVTWSRVA